MCASSPKPFNNMNLFRDVNNDIWMIGFAEEDDHSYTDLYVYKLTYDVPGGKRFMGTAKITYTKRLYPTVPESANSISGRWGASLYFDGENLHVFMSDRNPETSSGEDENRVFYNHWGKID